MARESGIGFEQLTGVVTHAAEGREQAARFDDDFRHGWICHGNHSPAVVMRRPKVPPLSFTVLGLSPNKT
jgi:hypothetical protein